MDPRLAGQRQAVRLARVDMLNASAKFGAIVNRRFGSVKHDIYEAAAVGVERTARAFVAAEAALRQAERELAGDIVPLRPRAVDGGSR